MKIAMVGHFPAPGSQITGGVERVIDTLTSALAKHAEVELFAPSLRRDLRLEGGAVPINYIKRAPGPGVLRYWSVDAWRTTRAVEAFRADIVHVQGMAGLVRRLTPPSVFTLHGVADKDLLAVGRGRRWGGVAQRLAADWIRCVEDHGVGRIGNVITVSPYASEILPQMQKCNLFYIPNPVDNKYCDSPSTRSQEEAGLTVLSLGRVSPLKNTLGAIRVVARVMRDNPKIRYSICGSLALADYVAECRKAAAEAGVEERVEFTGDLTVDQIVRRLDNASCLIVTSLREMAPLVIAEAHARGLPVVGPFDFGIKYMITEGFNGLFWLRDELEVDAQAEILRRALSLRWDRSAISRKAIGTYSAAAIAEKTLEVYEHVIDRAKSELSILRSG